MQRVREGGIPKIEFRVVRPTSTGATWVTIDKPFHAAAVGQALIPDDGCEHFIVLLLNSANHVLGWHEVGVGGVSSVTSSPREIIRAALLTPGCASILCVHSHPSGSTVPSKHDNRLTFDIAKAAKLFDLRLHDHVIINHVTGGFYSFDTMGGIPQ